MSEQAKYYTPSIEEFHVGFEYEQKISSNHDEWMSVKIESGNQTISLCGTYKDDWDLQKLNINDTKVKCLDKEDIKNLGFDAIEELGNEPCVHGQKQYSHPHYLVRFKNGTCNLKYIHFSKWLVISVGEEKEYKQTVFAGTIKNKSELKKLMIQLGINGN